MIFWDWTRMSDNVSIKNPLTTVQPDNILIHFWGSVGVCLSTLDSFIRLHLNNMVKMANRCIASKNMNKDNLHISQENVCNSPQELECTNNVKVDTSSCLKPCSGLIVTSFYKSQLKKELATLFPIFGDYNLYKKVTTHPSVANGMS